MSGQWEEMSWIPDFTVNMKRARRGPANRDLDEIAREGARAMPSVTSARREKEWEEQQGQV